MRSPSVGEVVIGICTLLGIRELSCKRTHRKCLGVARSSAHRSTRLRNFWGLNLYVPLRVGEAPPNTPLDALEVTAPGNPRYNAQTGQRPRQT